MIDDIDMSIRNTHLYLCHPSLKSNIGILTTATLYSCYDFVSHNDFSKHFISDVDHAMERSAIIKEQTLQTYKKHIKAKGTQSEEKTFNVITQFQIT